MKTHGLWVFHRLARQARRSADSPRWWVDDEIDRARRMIDVMLSGYGRSGYPTLAERVIRCANRYARRFGCVRTVADWNRLCETIRDRAGWGHRGTERASELAGYRDTSPLHWRNDSFLGGELFAPRPRHTAFEIEARAERITRRRELRIKTETEERDRLLATSCAICGSKPVLPEWIPLPSYPQYKHGPLVELLTMLDDSTRKDRHGRVYMCFTHRMRFHKLKRLALLQDDARILINRTRRKLNEAAKSPT